MVAGGFESHPTHFSNKSPDKVTFQIRAKSGEAPESTKV